MDSGDTKNDKANESNGKKAENILHNTDEEKQLPPNNEMDDREEGEIVDDYDFIISSDEELCMRRRIEELEAKNEELEKIAKISAAPVMKYAMNSHYDKKLAKHQWNLLKGTQKRHSEMSDDAYTPSSKHSKEKKLKKRRHKRSKATNDQERRKKKSVERDQNLEVCYQNQCNKKTRYNTDYTIDDFNPQQPELFIRRESENTIDSLDDRQGRRFSNSKSCVSKEMSKTKKKHSKKKRSEKSKDCEHLLKSERKSSIQTIVVDDDSSSDTQSLEEQELRLLALKSAVMKKHLARKKRDAEIAYSPTDFENRLGKSQGDIFDIVDVEMEEWEDSTKDIMDVSPVASPTLYLNSRDDEKETQNNYADENTKMIDMDIVNSDSDDNIGVIQVSQSDILKPLENLQQSCSQLENNKNYKDDFSSTLPQIPSRCQFVPISLYPNTTELRPRKSYNISHVINSSINENSQISQLDEKSSNFKEKYINNLIHGECNENQNISLPFTNTEVIRDEDEEEALRTLLLSRLSSSKTLKMDSLNNIDSSNSPKFKTNSQEDDPDKLRSLLLTSMNMKCTPPTSPSESILKEALRRIKMKTCSEDGENVIKEDSTSNLCKSSPKHSTSIAKSSFQENSSTPENGNVRSVEREATCRVDEYAKSAESVTTFEQLNVATKKSMVVVRSVEQINEILTLENNKELEMRLSETENQIKKVIESTKNAELKEKGQIEKMKIDQQNTEQHDSKEFLIKENSLSNSTMSESTTKLITEKNENMMANTIMTENNSKIKLIPKTQECRNTDLAKNFKPKPHIPKNKTIEKPAKASTTFKVISKGRNTSSLSACFTKRITTVNKINTKNYIRTGNVSPKVVHTQKSLSLEKANSPTPPLLRQIPSNTEIPNVQVKKLVITLKTSDTETSEEEDFRDAFSLRKQKEANVDKGQPANKTKSTNLGIIYENSEKNRPSIENSNDQNTKSTESPDLGRSTKECFEKKLEAFLKSARSRVQNISPSTSTISNNNNSGILKKFSTPVAVRHLPYSAQQEYCRLVHRMKLLEKRNKKPTKQSQEKPQKSPTNNILETEVDIIKSSNITESSSETINVQQIDTPKPLNKTENLVKSISPECQPDTPKPLNDTENLVKGNSLQECQANVSTPSNNAEKIANKITIESQADITKSSNGAYNYVTSTSVEEVSEPITNSNVSKARDILIHKTGICVITSLDKSLQLVAEAKRVKKAKLTYEKRLNELRSEMEEVRNKMRQEQQRMSKTFSKINESNKVVTTLKERYRKLTRSGSNSGNVKENVHRFNNDLKQEIIKKSKLLAAEIKEVNAMKSFPTPASNILRNKILPTIDENCPASQNSNDNAQKATKPNEINLTTNEGSINESVTEENSLLNHVIEVKESLKPSSIRVNEEVENKREELLPKDEQSSKTVDENGVTEIHKENVEEKGEVGKNGSVGENDEICKEESTTQNDVENCRNHISEYISPLVTLKMSESALNPNGIICPYDLMGQCEDKDCHFDHLTVRKA